jgi:outer membrane protein insertion porin family
LSEYDEGKSTRLKLVLSIDEGENVHIDDIRVSGNKETSEHVIIRETGVRPGDTYNKDKIDRIPQRLARMNIFSSVGEPEFSVNKAGAGSLLVPVKEGNTNTFDGVIGFVPASSAGQSGYVMGLVNVSMRNLLGTARKLNVRWQRDDQHSQELAADYLEPWILDLPLDGGVAFQQRQQDTTYVRRNLELRADVHLFENMTVGGTFSQVDVIPSSTLTGVALANSRTVATGLRLDYDSRDDLYSPTGGVVYRNDYEFGHKSIENPPTGGQNRFTVQRVGFDAELYVQPVLHQVVAVGLHGRGLTSDDIELGDLYRFGGATTLRGYRENQFLGSRIAWTNTEYRFLLARRSFFFGFFDTGYYFLPEDVTLGISSVEHLKYGYGVGVRVDTPLGNIGVSFALGQGDSFSQGKIHIGLINGF